MSLNNINNICLIFSENPIGRAYLYLLLKEKLVFNKIIYLDHRLIFNNFFLKLKHNLFIKNIKKYLKYKDVLTFIKNIENHFNLEENFLIEMYNFENIFKFKNVHFAKSSNINNKYNVEFFTNLNENNFLISSNTLLKNILNSNKKFYHIHPGYLYKVRGADGTLNSIKYFNEIGSSFYLINNKIDSGKILTRMTYPYRKISFPNYKNFKIQDLYQIWFSFYDPAVRISLLRDILKKNIDLNNYLELDLVNEENNYYSFLKNKDLNDLFLNRIFKI